MGGLEGLLETIHVDAELEDLPSIQDTHRHLVAELIRPSLILVDVSHLDLERNSAAKLLELLLGDITEVTA